MYLKILVHIENSFDFKNLEHSVQQSTQQLKCMTSLYDTELHNTYMFHFKYHEASLKVKRHGHWLAMQPSKSIHNLPEDGIMKGT